MQTFVESFSNELVNWKEKKQSGFDVCIAALFIWRHHIPQSSSGRCFYSDFNHIKRCLFFFLAFFLLIIFKMQLVKQGNQTLKAKHICFYFVGYLENRIMKLILSTPSLPVII